jgi:ABC-type uncharacterized transport system permease subunit
MPSDSRVPVFQFSIFSLYVIAGVLLAMTRLPRFAQRSNFLLGIAMICGLGGFAWHAATLWSLIILPDGLSLSIGNAASFIGLLIALVALFGSLQPTLRGLAGGLFILAGATAALTGWQTPAPPGNPISWQIQAHVLISLFAYGLLSVGAIVALFALVQEKRLQARNFSPANQLFAPMETTENLLFGVTASGFLALLFAVFSGIVFVDDFFARHLVHKTALSLLALILFGVLLAGRQFAGWRGKRAVYLYLWGFVILCLAYFGSRYVLEEILGRSWS